MTSTIRQRLLASTLLMGAAALATPAWAQDQQGVPEDPQAVQEPGVEATADPSPGPTEAGQTRDEAARGEIIVTGSRIARPDLTSTSPLAVVNDEEFKLSGAVNVEQVINTLPQVLPGVTAFSNNPGNGTATLNLRGLGSTRNLVLVNGRRYIFFGTTQVVDVNTIPAFLIDSVDVVTGGASAVYGSDALAGVVNFKLRGVRGLEMGGQVSITEKGDGRRWNVYGAIGTDVADGRGNITVYGEYFNRGQIFQSDRSFSAFALGDDVDCDDDPQLCGQTAGWGRAVEGLSPFGSANVPWGRFPVPATVAIGTGASCGGANQPPRNAGCFPIAEGTIFAGFGAQFRQPGVGTAFQNPEDTYNYAPSNYLMVPQERFTLGGMGDFEITPFATAYMEVNFIHNRVQNELAPTPITQNVNFNLARIQPLVDAATFAQLQQIAANQQAAIAAAANPNCRIVDGVPQPCVNPFGPVPTGSVLVPALQPGEVRLQVSTRTTGVGPRNSDDERNAYRLLGGFRGNITSDLTYDLYYMYARTRNSQIQSGNISRSAFFEEVTRANGIVGCNVFGETIETFTPECINALSIQAQNATMSTLQVAQGSVSGSIFTMPWATNAVGFAAGAEYRKMAAQFVPDTALSSGDVVGFNAGLPTEGRYDVRELFGEVRIPIVEDGFLHRFELSGAGRYSDYSLQAVGGVWTYAAGAELAPIPDITFRGQYQRAVRAPNVAELFGGQSIGFPPATDPCSSRLAPALRTEAVRQVCIATGVPATSVWTAPIQPNSQIEGLFGGNVDLQEETGDTFTVGAVVRPRFIPRLNVTVDYYDIKVKDIITTAFGGVNSILNLCYNVIQDPNNEVCQLISRNPAGVISGPPFVVTALNDNLSEFHTKGVDFQVDYNLPLNFSMLGAGRSRLSFFFLGNHTIKSNTLPLPLIPESLIECAGRFGLDCGDSTPRWAWNSRVSLQDGPLTTSLRWRHQSPVRDDDDETDYVVERIGAYDLFDLAFAFNVSDNMNVTMGVNNLLNKKPPVIGDNQEQANTYPATYNVIGRDYFISTNIRF